MNPDAKMRDWDDGDKMFDFQLFLPLFWSKIITQNKVLWVLKRSKLDEANLAVPIKQNYSKQNSPYWAFSTNWVLWLNFSGDFTTCNLEKCLFDLPSISSKISIWILRLDDLRTFFHVENSSVFDPYPNKEHYLQTVYIILLSALFNYGTNSDGFLISKNVLNSSFKSPDWYFWRKKFKFLRGSKWMH